MVTSGAPFTDMVNFNPSMDKYNHMPNKVWDEITHPFPNFYCSSLGMDK